MKVTVYFGNIRVIVPCGKGDILVRELMDLAITRYKKATRKCPSSSVTIHNLKSSRDDGILYPDDRLDDVADDREQIVAVFEEEEDPSCPPPPSPPRDPFSVEVSSLDGEAADDAGSCCGAGLQVRRGSEPALHCLFPAAQDPNKRWSTAVVLHPPDVNGNGPAEESPDSEGGSGSFLRGSGRLSVLGGDAETCRWVEAADRQLMKDFNENFAAAACNGDGGEESDGSGSGDEREKTIVLKNESGPLGIHVVPDYDGRGRDVGLVIQGIEAGGRIDRDGRLRVGDRITDINGRSLLGLGFRAAQEVFRAALLMPPSSRIRLGLARGGAGRRAAAPRKPPPPVYPPPPRAGEGEASLVEGEERAGGTSTRVATVSPTKKVPASATRRLASANTRRIGRMLTVQLTKGAWGLGFSITTRDNSAGGRSPIYVKSILPRGAAVEDGGLLPGDRLLEVNGVPMTGKSQSEAASILRDIPPGESVRLVVSRQEPDPPDAEPSTQPVAPACPEVVEGQPVEEEEGAGVFPWKHREILTFRIPLEEPGGGGGLGVSVKGKSTTTPGGSSTVDLGIFVKGVIPGGAADRDGRLCTNDQLVNINGLSLLGASNADAMEALRGAMARPSGPLRDALILTVARRASRPPSEGADPEADQLQGRPEAPPGPNPVVERLTGQTAEGVYGYHRVPRMVVTDADAKGPALYSSLGGESVLIEGEYDPAAARKVPGAPQQSSGKPAPENEGVAPAGSQLSLSEEWGEGFARDGFGRQSMSEKRHAQLDARGTDTYQRSKRAREERDRQRQQLCGKEEGEEERRAPAGEPLTDPECGPVGPALGLRKSSSLESLQTLVQELSRDREAEGRGQGGAGRGGPRGRGCNESFRAAVDRSYDAPPSSPSAATAMETLDEESESGSSSGHPLTRSLEPAEDREEDPLNAHCRGSKSSKKKSGSLLKGLGSVFKFGKNRKHSQDSRGKFDEDGSQDGDFHQSSSRDSDRASEASDVQRRRLPAVPPRAEEGGPRDRQERMQSLREQHQRMHARRRGQYPLDRREEYLEGVLREEEEGGPARRAVSQYDVVHGRSRSLDIHEETTRGPPGSAPSVEGGRYGHYMNYREIQQHIHQRVRQPPPQDFRRPYPEEPPCFPPHDPGGHFGQHGLYADSKHYSRIIPGSKV